MTLLPRPMLVPNRRLSVTFLWDSTPYQMSEARQSLFGDAQQAGGGCYGPQKLVQNFIAALYARTNRPFSNGGTSFANRVLAGTVRTVEDVRREFSVAANGIVQKMVLHSKKYPTPPDEVPASIKLISAEIHSGVLRLNIEIKTAAGSSTTFAFPLTNIL